MSLQSRESRRELKNRSASASYRHPPSTLSFPCSSATPPVFRQSALLVCAWGLYLYQSLFSSLESVQQMVHHGSLCVVGSKRREEEREESSKSDQPLVSPRCTVSVGRDWLSLLLSVG